ncbi:MAG: efflux RND transporter permease subunit [Planctomycetota bacterium]
MSTLLFRNRRLLILVVAGVTVAGLSAYQVLPRLEDPQLTNRFATVKTIFPGASAERVEALVTEKLEEEIREVEEIKLVKSSSRAGFSLIAVELRDDIYAVDEVWSRIRDKVDDATAGFPSGVPDPEFEVTEVGAFARIVALTWTQDNDPNYAILRRHAESLEQLLRGIPGSDDVEVFGEPSEEVVVEMDAATLAAMGLTADAVAAQLQASDAKVAAGQYRSRRDTLVIEVDAELDTLERIRRTPIQYAAGGRFVPLSSVAEVFKGRKNPPDDMAIVDGRPAVIVAARVQPDQRIDLWAAEAKKRIADFSATLPRGVGLSTVFAQDTYVTQRMDSLVWNLLSGATAVLLVMLVMMGWRSALIVCAALPLTALTVVFGLKVLGIPIHQMSVTGLVIALGLLIDNAIVIVDEVRARLREGKPPLAAVDEAVRHLAMPLFASTLTTALAFAPIALMPGPAGEFVGSIAISVILAIFSSLALSLTVLAALAAMGSTSRIIRDPDWFADGFSSTRLSQGFDRFLAAAYARPIRSIATVMALPALGFVALSTLSEQFFPPEERNQFHIELELPAQASLANTLEMVRRVREVALARPEIDRVDWFLGRSAAPFYYNVIATRENSAPYAQAIVATNTDLSSKDLLIDLQRELDAAFPDARLVVRQLEQGPPFNAPVEIQLYGPDLDGLRALGNEIRGVLAEVDDVVHATADLTDTVPKLALRIDEEQARLAGLDHAEISRQLDATLEGAVGGSVLEGTEELPVRVRVADARRGDLSAIASLDLLSRHARDGSTSQVPLDALAEIRLVPEEATIQRRNGERINEVRAYITAGVLPSKVLGDFEERLAARGFTPPAGYRMSLGGEAAERDAAVGNLMSSVAPLMVLMVASLVLSFGSFRMAALIGLVGTLSIGIGGAMLWLFDYPFGFMAIIGTMGLVGVAINDSIVVLAALREDRRARSGEPAAIRRIVMRASRHVLSTTFTTVAGFVPLMIWGGAFWGPLAVVIAGGVSGSTLLALILVPSSYILLTGQVARDAPARSRGGAISQLSHRPSRQSAAASQGSLIEVAATSGDV